MTVSRHMCLLLEISHICIKATLSLACANKYVICLRYKSKLYGNHHETGLCKLVYNLLEVSHCCMEASFKSLSVCGQVSLLLEVRHLCMLATISLQVCLLCKISHSSMEAFLGLCQQVCLLLEVSHLCLDTTPHPTLCPQVFILSKILQCICL